VAQNTILISLARWPYLRHKSLDGVLGYSSHADGGTDRIALNERCNDLDSLSWGQAIHDGPILMLSSKHVKKYFYHLIILLAVLAGFC